MLCDFGSCTNKRKKDSSYCAAHQQASLPTYVQDEVKKIQGTYKPPVPENLRCTYPNCRRAFTSLDLKVCKKHNPKRRDKLRKKEKKAKKGKKTRNAIHNLAQKLNRNLPKSEQWFLSFYGPHKDKHDVINKPWEGYIPDIINHKYKYVIEIDGSYHTREDQLRKDALKDKYYAFKGYQVFRVPYDPKDLAKSEQAAKDALAKVFQIRGIKERVVYFFDEFTGYEFSFSYPSG